jgi:hypothetical protein
MIDYADFSETVVFCVIAIAISPRSAGEGQIAGLVWRPTRSSRCDRTSISDFCNDIIHLLLV